VNSTTDVFLQATRRADGSSAIQAVSRVAAGSDEEEGKDAAAA
jgi:hypothetical protein